MNPEQRRAHLVLQGQTLLDEWLQYCASQRAAPDWVAWDRAVVRLLGRIERAVIWTHHGCRLPNGEVYLYPDNMLGEIE